MTKPKIDAEVISVFPDKVVVSVDEIRDFEADGESLKIGSYLKISDNANAMLMASISHFSIAVDNSGEKKYIIEAVPLGVLRGDEFIRGGDNIALPPKKVEPAAAKDIESIYSSTLSEQERFDFSKLTTNSAVSVPVNGNDFFNKHIAIIGSTGSGKSHTVAAILQKATKGDGGPLNNSHVVIFDIHSEYKAAFPASNHIDIDSLLLPYWLMNSEELESILLDTGERDNYNQAAVFRMLVTNNKKRHNPQVNVFYDTPIYFDINEVLNALVNISKETVNSKNRTRAMIIGDEGILEQGKTNNESGEDWNEEEKIQRYFDKEYSFYPVKNSNVTKGVYADGSLEKFISRLKRKINDQRLSFLFSEDSKNLKLENVLEQLLGYQDQSKSNVIILDLSGIPFEVLNITVSLISRTLFEYGYFYKKVRERRREARTVGTDVPLLLVYEEAHRYVPNDNLTKYRSSRESIERIAKEGRKYGISIMLSSQRPAEISETIFSQCNNFISMRLTNPTDQQYVKRLLPDAMGSVLEQLPTLRAGEGILIGDSVILPSAVKIDFCEPAPSSNDIPFWDLWREEWKDIDFVELKKEWYK
ncbi:DUF87 domain-containing protein [Planococcaceae bacterium Storch 2/2-2]|nr:DUF87 domain-containing protein [Planococcaceae bacterium Storch 2/2-2]